MMRAPRLSRVIVVCIVAISFLVAPGCYGPFNLTRNVYHWNSGIKGSGEVNEKWMKEIVFFGMIVIPVYMFSALLDAFVFNAIQFWSGSNPVKMTQGPDGFPEDVHAGAATIHFDWSPARRSATVTYRRNGDVIKQVTIAARGGAYQVIDEETTVLSVIEQGANGDTRILDDECRMITRVSSERWRIPHVSVSEGQG